MIPSPADLLRVLGSGLRPDGAAEGVRAADGADFQTLLARARAGSLETGLPVTVADGAGLELSEEQLARLGRVVDRAHAEGATRILVMLDGVALDVDVLSRRVLGEADLAGGRVLTGIDGFVRLGEGDDGASGVLPLPSAGAVDASVLAMLAGEDKDAA
ncbi:MAG: hypothetical protein IT431_14380 [Phycisphaerales bacterium]|nr:hypothetical protein [Phycisphaerales bacterium]